MDLLLVRQHEYVDAAKLRNAIRQVFNRRATHPVPARLLPPPRALAVAYRRAAEPVGVATTLDAAHQLLADWLDPVLAEIHEVGDGGDMPGRRN